MFLTLYIFRFKVQNSTENESATISDLSLSICSVGEGGQVPVSAGIGVAVVAPLAVHDQQHDGQRGRDQTEALSRPSPIKGSNFVKKKLSQFRRFPIQLKTLNFIIQELNFCIVSLVRENLRGLRENLKHKIRA